MGCLNHNLRMSARWITFIVWAAVAASAFFWGLKLLVKPPLAPAQTQVADTAAALRGDLTRLLGADAPPIAAAAAAEPAPDARFNLLGVVSPKSPRAVHEGVALIAVDGKIPKAFKVGAVVDGQQVLKSVHARGASLGPKDGPAQIALSLAPPAPAQTGQLPSASSNQAPAPPQPPRPAMQPPSPSPQALQPLPPAVAPLEPPQRLPPGTNRANLPQM